MVWSRRMVMAPSALTMRRPRRLRIPLRTFVSPPPCAPRGGPNYLVSFPGGAHACLPWTFATRISHQLAAQRPRLLARMTVAVWGAPVSGCKGDGHGDARDDVPDEAPGGERSDVGGGAGGGRGGAAPPVDPAALRPGRPQAVCGPHRRPDPPGADARAHPAHRPTRADRGGHHGESTALPRHGAPRISGE